MEYTKAEQAALAKHEAFHTMHQRIAKLEAEFIDRSTATTTLYLKQLEIEAVENNRPYIDLRDSADSELALLVSNNEELYNLRDKPNELMAVLADDYKFTWWQVWQLIDDLDRLKLT